MQKMYRNANQLIGAKKAKTSASDRHQVAMSLIKHTARRHEGTMLSCLDPLQAFNDNIVIPGSQGDENPSELGPPAPLAILPRSRAAGRRSGVVSMTISTDSNATITTSNTGDDSSIRVIDRMRVASWIQKVTDAEEGAIPEWEARDTRRREDLDRKHKRKMRQETVAHTHHVMKMLENKLIKSVVSFHAALGDDDPAKAAETKPITTRDLLPYYRADDFKNFFNVYLCVDEEFRGELNIKQWVHFFSKMKKTVSKKTAYLLFTDIDKDADGKLTVQDLVEFIFSKADARQLELMKSNIMKVIRKNQAVGVSGITKAEVNQIFEYYDEDFVGYVKLRNLKDRLKSFNLPAAANVSIYANFEDLYDDDMISSTEFVRLFKPYLIIDHIQ